jgi:hypothetical protein
MDKARAKRDLPPFSDAALRAPARLHDDRCPGAVQQNGLPPRGRCNCDSATSMVPSGSIGSLHIQDFKGASSLVSFAGYGPAWFESKGLHELRDMQPVKMSPGGPDCPVDQGTDDRPADIQLFEGWTKKNGTPKYGRRRRPIKGGELVYVRQERLAGRFEPWRFVFCSRREGVHVAVLARPELPPTGVISPDWDEVRLIPLKEDGLPHRVLFPVYPLPDGTEDPGWSAS